MGTVITAKFSDDILDETETITTTVAGTDSLQKPISFVFTARQVRYTLGSP